MLAACVLTEHGCPIAPPTCYNRLPQQWEFLPQELVFDSGMTCWRRLREWSGAGV